MNFAELRQTVLQQNALSLDYFAEEASLQQGPSGFEQTLRCKITHRSETTSQGPQVQQGEPLDEMEEIKVLVSRDASFTGSLPARPAVGAILRRSVTRDADRRPFAFAGEVEYEGDQHAVYIFQRPRRVATGRR